MFVLLLVKLIFQTKKSGFADDGKAPFVVRGGDAKRKRETRDSKFGFGGKKRVRYFILFFFSKEDI